MAITLGCEQIVFIYLRGYFEHILVVMEKFMIAYMLSRFLFGTIAAKMPRCYSIFLGRVAGVMILFENGKKRIIGSNTPWMHHISFTVRLGNMEPTLCLCKSFWIISLLLEQEIYNKNKMRYYLLVSYLVVLFFYCNLSNRNKNRNNIKIP